jgi:hypothetical protein
MALRQCIKDYNKQCRIFVRKYNELWIDRELQYPNGGPILNFRPTNEELKAILLKALERCNIPSILQYYNTLLETKNRNIQFEKIFDEVRNLAITDERTRIFQTLSRPSREPLQYSTREREW